MTIRSRIAFGAGIAVLLDAGTKFAASRLDGDLYLIRPRVNHDLALGVFQTSPSRPVAALLALAVGCLAIYGTRLMRTGQLSPFAFSLLGAGAAANLADRLITGGVHDWLWIGVAIANLADVWIFAGLAWFVVAAWQAPATAILAETQATSRS